MTKTSGAIAPLQAAYDAVAQAHNTTSLAASSFTQIGALFHAIRNAAPEHHITHDLASLGGYLCNDWSEMHDCEHESLTEHFDKFHAVLYPEKGSNNE